MVALNSIWLRVIGAVTGIVILGEALALAKHHDLLRYVLLNQLLYNPALYQILLFPGMFKPLVT